jgi:hypothetical protein
VLPSGLQNNISTEGTPSAMLQLAPANDAFKALGVGCASLIVSAALSKKERFQRLYWLRKTHVLYQGTIFNRAVTA